METEDLKALARRVLERNLQGNSRETSLGAKGNFHGRAYKVYSEALNAYLWVVADDKNMKALKASQNVTEAIYTHDEIKKLRGMDNAGLKAVHKVKEVFEDSKVKKVNLNYTEG